VVIISDGQIFTWVDGPGENAAEIRVEDFVPTAGIHRAAVRVRFGDIMQNFRDAGYTVEEYPAELDDVEGFIK
jgi:hypothetical protein